MAEQSNGIREPVSGLEQALLGSILDTVPDALIVIDDRGRIISFSRAAQHMFQYDEAEVEIGRAHV